MVVAMNPEFENLESHADAALAPPTDADGQLQLFPVEHPRLAVHHSSARHDWQTPRALFDQLHHEFAFEIDLAASYENTLLPRYLSDALDVPWHTIAKRGFCNPPYARGVQAKFIAKAAAEQLCGFTTVMLLPARTDTRAFHNFIYQKPWVRVRFLLGRLRFSGSKDPAPFPSMVVIFDAR